MTYKTHLSTALVITLPIMTTTNTLEVASIAALSLGCFFLDIDEPNSWIGRRTRGVSDLINRIFGHREITHSIIGLTIIAGCAMLLVHFTPLPAMASIYFIAGCTLHLVTDSFSKSGVKWLWPKKKRFQSGFNKIYYITGGVVEKIVFTATLIFLAWYFYNFVEMDVLVWVR